jgi:hypothetical protein
VTTTTHPDTITMPGNFGHLSDEDMRQELAKLSPEELRQLQIDQFLYMEARLKVIHASLDDPLDVARHLVQLLEKLDPIGGRRKP